MSNNPHYLKRHSLTYGKGKEEGYDFSIGSIKNGSKMILNPKIGTCFRDCSLMRASHKFIEMKNC